MTKRRRGAVNLLELVCCMVIFAFVVGAALSVMAAGNQAVIRENKEFVHQTNLEFLLDELTQDIKSSRDVTATGDHLSIIRSDDSLATYTVSGTKIYRNDEMAISNLILAYFQEIDEDRVSVYIFANDGTRIDTVIHR